MKENIYNYGEFSPHSYDFTKQSGLIVGDTLPSLSLTALDGNLVTLESFAGNILVIETGSMSCPLFIGKIKTMNALACEHPDIQFIVIYIREAHPGKHIPSHQTDADKLGNAKRLKRAEPENRTILVDTIGGDAHKYLGLLPNMAYIISADQKIIYRADWNIPVRIGDALEAIKSKAPVSQQPADFTPVAPHYSLRVLARAGGLGAVWAFISHLPQLIKQHKTHIKNRDSS